MDCSSSCWAVFQTIDILLTDDPKLVCSCLCEYVSNTAHCSKWALNNFESSRSRVSVEESFPNDVLSSDDPKLLPCTSIIRKWGRRMDGVSSDAPVETNFRSAIRALTSAIRWQTCAEVCYTIADLQLMEGPSTWTIDLPSCTNFPMMTSLPYDIYIYVYIDKCVQRVFELKHKYHFKSSKSENERAD